MNANLSFALEKGHCTFIHCPMDRHEPNKYQRCWKALDVPFCYQMIQNVFHRTSAPTVKSDFKTDINMTSDSWAEQQHRNILLQTKHIAGNRNREASSLVIMYLVRFSINSAAILKPNRVILRSQYQISMVLPT